MRAAHTELNGGCGRRTDLDQQGRREHSDLELLQPEPLADPVEVALNGVDRFAGQRHRHAHSHNEFLDLPQIGTT